MADYVIINALKDKDLQLQHGSFTVYKMQLAGVEGLVEVLQKPETPAPTGTISGTITDSQYGKKFKKDQGTSGGRGGYARDDNAIRAQWAIGQAVQVTLLSKTPDDQGAIEGLAKDLYAMVDRVKDSNKVAADPGDDAVPVEVYDEQPF